MNVKDLMLGNYVAVNSAVNPVVRVAEIYANGIIADDGSTWLEDEIRPIKLTTNDLEKNGWNYDGMYCNLTNDGFLYQYYPFEGIFRKFYIHKNGEGEVSYQSSPGLNYVHGLQNALRMCGAGIDRDRKSVV